MLPLYLTISLGAIGTIKDCMRSKSVPKFSPELCRKTWVSIIDHIVRGPKLSDNTLEKQLCNLFGTPLPLKYLQSKQCTLSNNQHRCKWHYNHLHKMATQ